MNNLVTFSIVFIATLSPLVIGDSLDEDNLRIAMIKNIDTTSISKCRYSEQGKRRLKRSNFGISESIYDLVINAKKEFGRGEVKSAIERLDSKISKARLEKSELIVLHETISDFYISENNLDNAIRHLELANKLIKPYSARQQRTLSKLAKLFASRKDFQNSFEYYTQWLSLTDKPDVENLTLFSAVSSEVGENQKSVCLAAKALNLEPKQPNQIYYLLLQGHINLRDKQGEEKIRELISSL